MLEVPASPGLPWPCFSSALLFSAAAACWGWFGPVRRSRPAGAPVSAPGFGPGEAVLVFVARRRRVLVFAGYYLWALSLGARASASATTTFGVCCFIGYELLGFGGLGPGRLELRTAGLAALRPYLIWLALYGAAIALLIGAAAGARIQGRNRRHWSLLLCCRLPPAFILGVGWVAHFRVLGRHFTPIVPVFLLLCASGLAGLWARRGAWARVVMLFCALSLLSCLSLRFLAPPRKGRLPRRGGVGQKGAGKGRSVWWNAAEVGAQYYHVPLATDPDSGAPRCSC